MHILNSLQLLKHLERDVSDHKGTSGKLVIIGGANTMSGSIVLAGLGALYTGSGWVKLIPLDPNFPNLIDSYPELMIYRPGKQLPSEILQEINPDVIVIGTGLGQSESSLAWLMATLERSQHIPLTQQTNRIACPVARTASALLLPFWRFQCTL